jgi:histidine triad (HIT) family protein
MKCIFCEIANKKGKAWIVYENKRLIAFFDKGSATKGHTLIAPKRHYENIYDIPKNLLGEITIVSKELSQRYKTKLKINAVNLVHASGKKAGQDVFHFHMHLIPRYKGDNINEHLWWKSNYQTKYDFDDLLKKVKSGNGNKLPKK